MAIDPLSLIVWVLVFALVFWLALYVINATLPANVQTVARVIVGVLALLVLLNLLVGYYPLPRFR